MKPSKFFYKKLFEYPRDITIAIIAVLLSTSIILSIGYILRSFIDLHYLDNFRDSINYLFLITFFLSMLLAISAYLRTRTTTLLATKIVDTLRSKIFLHILSLPIPEIEKNTTGNLLAKIDNDSEQLLTFISKSLAIFLRTTIQIIVGTLLLIFSSIKLALILIVMVPCIILPIVFLSKKVKQLTLKVGDSWGHAISFVEEHLNYLLDIKALNIQQYSANKFNQLLQKKNIINTQRIHYRSLLIGVVIFAIFVAIIFTFWIGVNEIFDNNITSGQLASFIFYAIILAGSVNNLAEITSDYSTTLGSVTRILKILQLQTECEVNNFNISHNNYEIDSIINLSPPINSFSPINSSPAINSTLSIKSIEFKEVSFCYPMRPEQKILSNITFSINQGDKIAIVAKSGVGKSTILKLLLRYYSNYQGQILINGHELKTLPLSQLRRLFAFIPQDCGIFNMSIKDNILIGDLNKDANFLTAAQDASVNEMVDKLKYGYDTVVGEKGSQISGGQKQRIALARAIFQNAPCLLFDEATNSLDSHSENKILQTINKLLTNKTIIMVTHQANIIKAMDKVLILANDGSIDCYGTHQQLSTSSKKYSNIIEA